MGVEHYVNYFRRVKSGPRRAQDRPPKTLPASMDVLLEEVAALPEVEKRAVASLLGALVADAAGTRAVCIIKHN